MGMIFIIIIIIKNDEGVEKFTHTSFSRIFIWKMNQTPTQSQFIFTQETL